MEDAKNAGNVRRLFHLIRSTGPRKPLVSETIRDQNGSLICNKAERLDRWAQYFEQQFSWPPATSNPESWHWRRCKKWRLIVVSGVHAVSFFPDCLIERLELGTERVLQLDDDDNLRDNERTDPLLRRQPAHSWYTEHRREPSLSQPSSMRWLPAVLVKSS
ncbi:hypothetical protein CLF_110807 [Clonorchis sinensis]|uniref:Uncharacterized protein n=1 Tax=Clonorchis sinensis TaxID=79923 RepID=G7YTW6_CLOSI|nr:hypothetical protein CLF_110807 [Clonorchis sinensis]